MGRGKRLCGFLLAFALCLTCLPGTALAREEAAAPEPEETAELNTETALPPETEQPAATEQPIETDQPVETDQPAETEQPVETETAAPAAEPEPAVPTEEEPESTLYMDVTGVTCADPEEYPDNDEQFAEYVNGVMGISTPAAFASLTTGDRLTGLTKKVYDALGDYIRQVAAGERASTVFTFSLADLGLAATRWTAADLGVDDVTAVSDDGTRYITAEAAAKALGEEHSWNISRLLYALLSDYPYELYWFDKTKTGGIVPSSVLYAIQENGEYVLCSSETLTLRFYVAREYSLAGTTGTLTVDTTVGESVSAAAENAAAIVSRYRAASDYSKLAGYRDEICELTDYNHDAVSVSGGVDYGNPWQLIWVFDGDSATNVVCEGYSKAFRYLCDMTLFDSDDIYCYTVTGTLVGAGAHMWNIVAMDDGNNYLTDLTNYDGGHEDLFLAPADGDAQTGYTCAGLTYIYADTQFTVYTTAELTLSAAAYARPGASAASADGFCYRVLADGTAAVTDYTGEETAVTIPAAAVLDGTEYPVTAIDDYAFQNKTALESVTIPATVTSIGYRAFSGCTALARADLPGGLTALGGYAFQGAHLTAVTVPATLETMGEAAFYGCDYLTDLTLAEGLTAISDYAFYNCSALAAVTLPATVTAIGKYAFAGCAALETAALPAGLTSIGGYAFRESANLTAVDIPASVKSVGAGAFASCAALETVTLGGTDITRAATDITVAWDAFDDTPWLEKQDDCLVIGGVVARYHGAGGPVTVPESASSIGSRAFYNQTAVTSVALPAGVTSIGTYAFSGCTALETVTAAGNITDVGRNAFQNTAWLAREDFAVVGGALVAYNGSDAVARVPDTARTVAGYAFYGRDTVTAVLLPATVTRLCGYAFYGALELTAVLFGGDAPVMADRAFFGLNITAGYYPESAGFTEDARLNYGGEASWAVLSGTCGDGLSWRFSVTDRKLSISGGGAMTEFAASSSVPWHPWRDLITGAEADSGVTSLTGYAFANCASLASAALPEGLMSIGIYAFYNCSALAAVDLPDTVTSIGKYAFRGCMGLTEITVPGSVKTIGDSAFRVCAGLRALTLSEGLESIEQTAFYQCTSLTAARLPASVTALGNFAFGGCTALKDIAFLGDAPEMGANGFSGVTAAAGYYEDAEGWSGARKDYGGALTWSALGLRYESLTSGDGKVTLRRDADTGAWDGEASVSITAAALDSGASLPWTAEDAPRRYAVYDISLTGGGPAGAVKVCVKAPLDFGENCRVYRVEADGSYTDMNARWLDGVIVFTTDHLSLYIIAQEKVENLSAGDANADGRVNVTDAMAIARAAVALIELDGDQKTAADVNGDGCITAADALLVAYYIVGAVDAFPGAAASG